MTRIWTVLVWLRSMALVAAVTAWFDSEPVEVCDGPEAGEIEVVERVASRVGGRNVECVEIVIDVLDLRSPRHGETEPAEQVDQLIGGLSQGMAMAEPGSNPGQGDVEAGLGVVRRSSRD